MHLAQTEVFPLDFEPILNADGARDCERNAVKRLCAALHERYHDLKSLLVKAALYAKAPHCAKSWATVGHSSSTSNRFTSMFVPTVRRTRRAGKSKNAVRQMPKV